MAVREKISVCGKCKHVIDAAGMPKVERVTDPEAFEKKTGVIVSHSLCRPCVDGDPELAALRAMRAEKKKAGL